jgi:hypothetical protein
MIRICYSKFHIGDRKFGEKEPLEDKRATHGLCGPCFEKEMGVIEETKRDASHIFDIIKR